MKRKLFLMLTAGIITSTSFTSPVWTYTSAGISNTMNLVVTDTKNALISTELCNGDSTLSVNDGKYALRITNNLTQLVEVRVFSDIFGFAYNNKNVGEDKAPKKNNAKSEKVAIRGGGYIVRKMDSIQPAQNARDNGDKKVFLLGPGQSTEIPISDITGINGIINSYREKKVMVVAKWDNGKAIIEHDLSEINIKDKVEGNNSEKRKKNNKSSYEPLNNNGDIKGQAIIKEISVEESYKDNKLEDVEDVEDIKDTKDTKDTKENKNGNNEDIKEIATQI